MGFSSSFKWTTHHGVVRVINLVNDGINIKLYFGMRLIGFLYMRIRWLCVFTLEGV